MAWGPFNLKEGGKPILDFLHKSIFPAVKEIQNLSLEIGDYKQGFFNSFFRKRLNNLQEKYRIVNKNFLQAYHVYQTPEELFKDINPDPKKDEQKTALMLGDYMNTKNAIMPIFQEGFGLLEVIDRNLNRYSQSADQRVSTFLSILAITISIIVALLKK